ncbi:hypothetical protein Salat_2782000 [Sesamum alatum]|uniref:Uncharacterized protein n=1 Tax=Sesamum alatum TaxID=300844 RepID=A0AAE1XKR3_9LAMI|nr:hypothetical protein Salat_2782000 [Sesamum alatum]
MNVFFLWPFPGLFRPVNMHIGGYPVKDFSSLKEVPTLAPRRQNSGLENEVTYYDSIISFEIATRGRKGLVGLANNQHQLLGIVRAPTILVVLSSIRTRPAAITLTVVRRGIEEQLFSRGMSPAPPFSESNIREKKVNPKFLRKQERVKFLFWDNKRSNESERSSDHSLQENRE